MNTHAHTENHAIAKHKCIHVYVYVRLSVCMDLVHGFLMELEQLVMDRSSCVYISNIESNVVVAFQFGMR